MIKMQATTFVTQLMLMKRLKTYCYVSQEELQSGRVFSSDLLWNSKIPTSPFVGQGTFHVLCPKEDKNSLAKSLVQGAGLGSEFT